MTVFDDISKQLEELKEQHDQLLEKAKENPMKILSDQGIDIDELQKLDKKRLQEIADNLNEQAENIQKTILNPNNSKSKNIENFQKKIDAQGGVLSEKDKSKMLNFFKDYIDVEQRDLAEACFHYESNNCRGGIIDAHSLQRKGPLYKIAIQEDNQYKVIHFQRDELSSEWKATSTPIKDASTFRGFCHNHDDIFSPIEKSTYTENNLQNFLHSYRSFAYSYHKMKEQYAYPLNLFEGMADKLGDLMGGLGSLFETIGGNTNKPVISTEVLRPTEEQKETLKALQFEKYKGKLNQFLKNKEYSALKYFVYEVNHICPLICSSWLRIHGEIKGGYVIENPTELYCGYPIMTTIFHTENDTTIILLARFKEDSITNYVFKQLDSLSGRELEQKLTTLIFEQVENFYLSPVFWNYLPQNEKNKLQNDINIEKKQFPTKSSFKASLNIFDPMHKLN